MLYFIIYQVDFCIKAAVLTDLHNNYWKKRWLLQNYSEFCNTMKLANSLCGGTPQSAGVGRERMRGQFAGYIPANRAEKFREAERS